MATNNDNLDLHICIIGAGMGGLSTALALAKRGFKNIAVYEAAADLGFVGAGIQLAPNMARILDRLGVWDAVAKEATDVRSTSIRQGATDDELANVDLSAIRATYGYPHMVGHRSSLAGALYAGCKKESSAITFHFSTAIREVQSFGPRPTFTVEHRGENAAREPSTITCDVLLAADGIKSRVREQLLQHQNVSARIIDTQQAAYRILLSREQMSSDPALLALLDSDRVTRWIGPRRHLIAYPVHNKSLYNISTTQPDTHFAAAPSATYTTRGSKTAMLDVFADFCPLIAKMLDLVPAGEVCEWKLRVHERLPRWTEGATTLVGDACHPTLPHLNQGAAQAIEDSAVLAVVLTRLPTPADPEAIARALRVYEKVRMERTYSLVEMAAANGKAMHLGEGAAKEERDRAFAALRRDGVKGAGGPVPDKWADADVQRMIYGEDVTRTAEEQFEALYAAL